MTAEAASGAPSAARPLEGACVLVTRALRQARALARPLEALGAEVIVAAVIDTVEPASWAPVDDAIARVGTYDWIVLTSTNAVDRFLDRMALLGSALPQADGPRIAVVGAATAARLEERGITPDLVPDDFRAEGLIERFRAIGVTPEMRFLLPRAERAREILPEALRADGAEVDVVTVYRTVPATPDPAAITRLEAGAVDVITFTSPSTVRHFIAWVVSAGLDPAEVLSRAAAASIGPVTSDALRERGHTVPIEAADSTMGSLVDGIVAHVAETSSAG